MIIFRSFPPLHVMLLSLFGSFVFVSLFTLVNSNTQKFNYMASEIAEIKTKQSNLEQNLPEDLYGDHLKLMDRQSLEMKLKALEAETALSSTAEADSELTKIQDILDTYQAFQSKMSRNQKLKLDTKESEDLLAAWGTKLLSKEYDVLTAEIGDQNTKLEDSYKKYLATLPPPPSSSEGYSYSTVTTERGTKHQVFLIKLPLSSVKVRTLAAISSDCSRDCDTKSLADYVKDAGGYAGIAGSYTCPADYAECANKKWSFDYALYDSSDEKWINKDALSWNKTGMITFNGRSASFYKETSDYDGDGVDAAISNFPTLLKDSDVVTDEGDVTSYQKVKGLRGAVGVGGENLYLAYITNASVEDAAYVMKALGAKNSLNLDGGGTAAMYINGGYVVGPGRPLANAVVLVR